LKADLKELAWKTIDENRKDIIRIGEELYNNPELGYKEVLATKLVASELGKLGLKAEEDLAVTGCRARARGGRSGPVIAVMGELDAVICQEHPHAGQGGAVHACGHNAQVAAMLGTAMGLIASGVMENLAGAIDFWGVPAEEYVELGYRAQLIEEGKIRFFGGKQELLVRGLLDDVDAAMMMHLLEMGSSGGKVMYAAQGNGFVGKNIRFIGKESHAGSAPEKGVNALNAAMLAMNNIHAQRETFSDHEKIRVHPIITKGGDLVNIVPADVTMETYVRGRTIEGILDASEKVNRSLLAGAMAVGAGVEITEIPGYLPLLHNDAMDQVFRANLGEFFAEDSIILGTEFGGSFDFGDLSHLMPTLHPFFGGVTGGLHTREFRITDPDLAYVLPAKVMAATLIDLLADERPRLTEIVESFTPTMSRVDYFELQEKVSRKITGP